MKEICLFLNSNKVVNRAIVGGFTGLTSALVALQVLSLAYITPLALTVIVSSLLLGSALGYCSVLPPKEDSTPSPHAPLREISTQSTPAKDSIDFQDLTLISGQLGSQPGGKYRSSTGAVYYVKHADRSKPERVEKLKSERLASELYKAASVPVVYFGEVTNFDSKYAIASKWCDELTILKDAEEDKYRLPPLHENFVIDCWLNNWDVIGLDLDNIGIVGSEAVRIDSGGCFDFRAQRGKKSDIPGQRDAFTRDVNMLSSSLSIGTAAQVFANTTLDHFRAGIQRLESLEDGTIHNLIMKYAPGSVDEKLDLFMLMLERKYFLLRYSDHISSQDGSKKLCEIVSHENLGLSAFKSQSVPFYPAHKDRSITKSSQMSAIAWDVTRRFYLHCKEDSYKSLYKKYNTPVPTYPIRRVKHGARHVIGAAIAVHFISTWTLHGRELSDEMEKALQIAALFHDAGRQSDVGLDQPEWEKQGATFCRSYLQELGFSSEVANKAADAIENKDRPGEKTLEQKILHDADCIEVIRSHNWVFNPRFLDAPDSANRQKLIKLYRKTLKELGDAPKEGEFDLLKKREIEHNPKAYDEMWTLFQLTLSS